MIISGVEKNDVRVIAEMEQECFEDPWSIAQINEEIYAETGFGLKAEKDCGTVGYAFFRIVGPEAELLRIAVKKAERAKGTGSAILKKLIAVARENGAEEMFLEVREKNAAARKMYEKAGFEKIGTRKDYYGKNENAVLYKRYIKE